MTDIITRALLSVSDKTGIVDFAARLAAAGIEILSTGGTAARLADAGIPVTEVAQYTGFPEIMDGRVKTLHPKIHGGILGRRGVDDAVMAAEGIGRIDLVVINLYPFVETIAREGVTRDEAIEQIDIGGPAMLRAAAKNHAHVAVVVDPRRYAGLADELQGSGGTIGAATRRTLAREAFEHTAAYDAAIAAYLKDEDGGSALDERLTLPYTRVSELRYGENPHQRAALYRSGAPRAGTIGGAEQRHGKALSFNNLADADAALEAVNALDAPACVIVKHANPCGVAVRDDLTEAYDLAYRCDPTSAFGGIIAFNRPPSRATLEAIVARQFVEVIVCPSIDDDALAGLAGKPDVRVLATGAATAGMPAPLNLRTIGGGLLAQDADTPALEAPVRADRVVTRRSPDARELADLRFAWRVAAAVKSNAIVYARDGATVGIGAGQMSRVVSARIAALKAADEGLEVAGAVMASDAFFPFRDGIDAAAEAGIRAVIQPGGSKRDDEVVAAADEHGIAMVFTGVRHFRH